MPCLLPSGLEQALACFVYQQRHRRSGGEISRNPKGARSLSGPSVALNGEGKHEGRSQPRVGGDYKETYTRDILFLRLPYSSSEVTDMEVWQTVGLTQRFSGVCALKLK